MTIKRYLRLMLFSITLSYTSVITSQGLTSASEPGIQVIGRSQKDAILLRWAPNAPVIWELANKNGYTIERYTIVRNGKTLDVPERKLITPSPIKPYPLASWEGLVEEELNDYAAISVQAIYGETFELTENYSTDITQVLNKVTELESRYSFALFAADHSLITAEYSGLYYKDEEIFPEEKYLYRIFAEIPPEIIELDTGFVFLGLEDYQPIPAPRELQVQFGDQTALLSWNGRAFDRFYNSFWIERSTDGIDFKKVNRRPLVSTFKGEEPTSRLSYYVDTLPSNLDTYYYRIRGITPFEELSPPSDTISGFATPTFQAAPQIIRHENSSGQVSLFWQITENSQNQVRNFEIGRAETEAGPFTVLNSSIGKSARSFVDNQPLNSAYYTLTAYDKFGNRSISFPYYVQRDDSIPPIPPVELTGIVDTSGIVTLTWKANSENDLDGYQVFVANYANDEMSKVTPSLIKTNSYTDTIDIQNLTRTIFYAVKAVDRRFNASELSEKLELIKPDLIPPSAPVFSKSSSDSSGIHIGWINSSSPDVTNHLLYRRHIGKSDWSLIAIFDTRDNTRSYYDTNTQPKSWYEYILVAIDENNLESDPTQPLRVQRFDNGLRPALENVFARRENGVIQIQWDYPYRPVTQIRIYRQTANQELQLYKAVPFEDGSFKDKNVRETEAYTYRLKAIFADGSDSGFSKKIEVK